MLDISKPETPQGRQDREIIRVVSVGHFADMALEYITGDGIEDVDFFSASTDSPDTLDTAEGVDLLFVAVEIGCEKDVETGCAIAEMVKDSRALVLFVAASQSESIENQANAEMITCVKAASDAFFIVPCGQRIQSFADALRVMLRCVVTDTLFSLQDESVDLADLRALFTNAGRVFFGIGTGQGENRATNAAQEAMNATITKPISVEISKVLMCVAGRDMSVSEIQKATEIVNGFAAENPEMIWCCVFDTDMGDSIRVMVIAA
ncbi:cell division protein FtsZ [Synergistales bacterium]|nr:cell division protein FtsZ [Synergistales bacterium]